MAIIQVYQSKSLTGTTIIPGDKSISHRSVMLGALADGITQITNFLASEDCLHTIACLRQLGITIDYCQDTVTVHGQGLWGLSEPEDVLDVGNSGTTMRLLAGILAGQSFCSFLNGDASLRKRPMRRITEPLALMGAQISGRDQANLAPLAIAGGRLFPISYRTPVASAQVKSAILLAGLFADGWTEVIEPAKSRDHTELMLQGFGVPVEVNGLKVRVQGNNPLQACEISVPGDISSAAFFLVAGCIMPNTRLVLKNVGLNPSRTGIIDVLQAMGGKISVTNQRFSAGEAVGDLVVESSALKGIRVDGDLIPRLIDEIPVLVVAAACATGTTEIRDAAELKVKETNRITAVVEEFSKLGVEISELADGMVIKGEQPLIGAACDSRGDHRLALSLAIAGLVASGTTTIENAECMDVSFPDFVSILTDVGGQLTWK